MWECGNVHLLRRQQLVCWCGLCTQREASWADERAPTEFLDTASTSSESPGSSKTNRAHEGYPLFSVDAYAVYVHASYASRDVMKDVPRTSIPWTPDCPTRRGTHPRTVKAEFIGPAKLSFGPDQVIWSKLTRTLTTAARRHNIVTHCIPGYLPIFICSICLW